MVNKKSTSDILTLQANELSVGYNGKNPPLHSNINISLKEGEFICLLGPNGAGKSTLIKTLSGFLKPMSGNVLYEDTPLDELPESQRAKMVSVVLTDKLQVPNLTVFELVSLGRTPYTGFFGRLSKDDVDIVYYAIEEVGLAEFAHKNIDKMSDGERQKAMIAKALVQQTPFIILDEPTAFLDLPAKLEIMQLLRRLSKEKGRGILLSTHDLEIALQIADKIWLLAQGKEIKEGWPEDLVLSDDFKMFFERDGVVFDNATGSFRYHKQKKQPVIVKGNGVAEHWVVRALNRYGYEAVENGSDYKISAISNGSYLFFLYYQDQLLIECDTIQELMGRLVQNI